MRRRTSIRETARRQVGKRTRFSPLIVAQIAALVVGLTSLACSAQQSRLANTLPDTSAPPPTLNLAASKDLSLPVDLLPFSGNPPDLPRTTEEALPDAPTPKIEPAAANSDRSADPNGADPNDANPNDANNDSDEIVGNLYASASATSEGPQQNQRQTSPGFPPISPTQRRLPPSRGEHPSIPSQTLPCQSNVCTSTPANMCCTRNVNYFERFVDAGIHPLTARQKGYLAIRNTVDPYNFATIGFFSAAPST